MTRHRGPESKDWPKEKQHRKEARNSKKKHRAASKDAT
jgi:hypothetical protein